MVDLKQKVFLNKGIIGTEFYTDIVQIFKCRSSIHQWQRRQNFHENAMICPCLKHVLKHLKHFSKFNRFTEYAESLTMFFFSFLSDVHSMVKSHPWVVYRTHSGSMN